MFFVFFISSTFSFYFGCFHRFTLYTEIKILPGSKILAPIPIVHCLSVLLDYCQHWIVIVFNESIKLLWPSLLWQTSLVPADLMVFCHGCFLFCKGHPTYFQLDSSQGCVLAIWWHSTLVLHQNRRECRRVLGGRWSHNPVVLLTAEGFDCNDGVL